MATAYLFAGQAAQFVGMGKELISTYSDTFDKANEILGFDLKSVMLEGPEEKLKQTIYTQPAVFLHSYLVWQLHRSSLEAPSAVAGHSLGELTALVAAEAISFESGMQLVKSRAEAMQKACEDNPSTMAAVLGMDDNAVEEICKSIAGIVVPANYNCPGQLVISGEKEAITEAVAKAKEAGAKRALEIQVGGAFHSPLMKSAVDTFAQAVEAVDFNDAQIPVYQNVDAQAHTDAAVLKKNIIKQIDHPVLWTQTIINMQNNGIENVVEIGGKGKILAGMVRKISRDISVKICTEHVE